MMDIEFIDLKRIEIDKDHLFNVRKNIEYNKPVLKFYKKLLFNSRFVSSASYRERVKEYEKYDKDSINWNRAYSEKLLTLENKIANLSVCNSFFLLNVYDKLKVKDFIKTNLCKDRFCANCKKVKQASRMARFIPEIQKYKDNSLYHLTLTIPNITGHALSFAVEMMFKAFATLIEYFKGKKKIRGIDFSKFGYKGAIRSLEVTFKKDYYHPHLHVLLCLDYEDTEKVHINKFSVRNGKMVRKFSDLEILIQKIWYLLINGKTVNLSNIKNIEGVRKRLKEKVVADLGYSCILDKFKEDDYHELFKYMTKTGDGENSITYDNFLILYFHLKSVRQIQGYGCFFRLKDIDMEDVVDTQYDTLVSILDSLDTPRVSTEKAEDLYLDNDYMLISRKKIHQYIRTIEQKEKLDCESSLKKC